MDTATSTNRHPGASRSSDEEPFGLATLAMIVAGF